VGHVPAPFEVQQLAGAVAGVQLEGYVPDPQYDCMITLICGHDCPSACRMEPAGSGGSPSAGRPAERCGFKAASNSAPPRTVEANLTIMAILHQGKGAGARAGTGGKGVRRRRCHRLSPS
jgi:hypothetical protein